MDCPFKSDKIILCEYCELYQKDTKLCIFNAINLSMKIIIKMLDGIDVVLKELIERIVEKNKKF